MAEIVGHAEICNERTLDLVRGAAQGDVELVDFKKILARCASAAVATRERPAVLGFLLDVDRLLADV